MVWDPSTLRYRAREGIIYGYTHTTPLLLSVYFSVILLCYKPPSGLLFSTLQAFRIWRERGWTWESHLSVSPRWCPQLQSGRPHSRHSRDPYMKRRGEHLRGQLYLDSSSSRVARLSCSSNLMLKHSQLRSHGWTKKVQLVTWPDPPGRIKTAGKARDNQLTQQTVTSRQSKGETPNMLRYGDARRTLVIRLCNYRPAKRTWID